MVERVARAIYAELAADPDWDDAPLSEEQRVSCDDDPSQEECRRLARAAISAMMEPTMAQYEALSATGKMWRELDSRTVWQTYVQAALHEGEG